MKKPILWGILFMSLISYSQKKKNGTIYIEHPAITMVENMTAAIVAGDTAKVAGYLADDFLQHYGNQTNKNAKGVAKKRLLNRINWEHNNMSYASVKRSEGAFPDALEYSDGTVWVQTWDHVKGVHNDTGVKFDVPVHNMYLVDKDNKIKTWIVYDNPLIWRELAQSDTDLKNGVLYKSHENINKVRRMMAAFEFNDWDTAYSFFDEDARFNNLETPVGESSSLAEVKERNKQMMEQFEISSIDVVGYPDYLEYDLNNDKVVQSWWNLRLIRKSDKKKIVMPALYIHDFNDEGKIIRSSAYLSTKILDSK